MVIVLNVSERRIGWNKDNENLMTIFDHLGYNIQFWIDESQSSLFRKIDVFLENLEVGCKSIIFFILAHGDHEKFYLSESEEGISYKEFLEKFKQMNIPKIFFFQCCRTFRGKIIKIAK